MKALTVAALIALTWFSGTAEAQRGPRGGGRDGGSQACFFTDTDFRGASFCLYSGGQERNLGEYPGWNDAISSISVDPGVTVTVCWDGFFSGACTTLNGSLSALWNLNGANWNDTISSVSVQGGGFPGGGPGGPGFPPRGPGGMGPRGPQFPGPQFPPRFPQGPRWPHGGRR